MFSPSGSVSEVILNGNPIDSVSRIALLLGRVENGGVIDSNEWTIGSIDQGATNDDLAELQAKINWLNLDSRWLSISTNSGRAVTSDNAFVDARQNDYISPLSGSNKNFDTARLQIEGAHGFAHAMRVAGVGR